MDLISQALEKCSSRRQGKFRSQLMSTLNQVAGNVKSDLGLNPGAERADIVLKWYSVLKIETLGENSERMIERFSLKKPQFYMFLPAGTGVAISRTR